MLNLQVLVSYRPEIGFKWSWVVHEVIKFDCLTLIVLYLSYHPIRSRMIVQIDVHIIFRQIGCCVKPYEI